MGTYLTDSDLTSRYVFYHIVTFRNKDEIPYKDLYDKYCVCDADRDCFDYIFSVRDKLLLIGCSKSMATCISRNIMDKGIFSDKELERRRYSFTGPDCGKSFKKYLNNYILVFIEKE